MLESPSFNLRREANPLATSEKLVELTSFRCFNLRREANPLATVHEKGNQQGVNKFQSQARSQSTGDVIRSWEMHKHDNVSISGEKPIHWRQTIGATPSPNPFCFNLRR